MLNKPAKLVEYIRDGLVEQEHYGFLIYADKNKIIEKIGENNDYPFFLRSCAKPLQASLLIDYGMDKAYKMTDKEITICLASHAGERIHTDTVSGLLNKIGLTEKDLKCGLHEPLSKTRQREMLLNGENFTQIHNNCSGKHTMMLGLSKLKGWDLKTYDRINHPLQKKIKEKIYSLCEITQEYPSTKDGCGVPIYAMPLKNMLKGYLNLFCDEKYSKLTNAILNNPYILGGENRTDTKIVAHSENIIAKVGACGLCIVVNLKEKSGFIVKISDSNMDAREYLVIDYLNKLGWSNIKSDRAIKTLHGDIIGTINTLI